jgi:competence protein ComEC
LWLWSAVAATSDGYLTVTLLDVPAGEALLVHTPTGRNLLINGGSSGVELQQQVAQQLPPYHRALDWLLVAGVRQEQVASLVNSLEALAPASVAWSGTPDGSFAARQLQARLQDSGIPWVDLHVGQTFDLGAGARIQVLAAGGRGALLMLTYGDFRMLLPFGADFDMLDDLDMGRALGPVNVLLLADNGYPPQSPPDWISHLDPDMIWWTVGKEAANAELPALTAGRAMLRTGLNGWGRLRTDGVQLWVESER